MTVDMTMNTSRLRIVPYYDELTSSLIYIQVVQKLKGKKATSIIIYPQDMAGLSWQMSGILLRKSMDDS